MGHLAHQVKEIYFALFSALKASASPRARRQIPLS